ncbi:KilA-N domain-containing protein [Psychrobacter urativorans]|uniref:KilA-N domain-containing protein n=1 Tax=Psychrobacter urativorans TaxID=45610 RepID=UPI00191A6E3F|nr:KilA-N domain-containing protein [Psychrobacter urativorans]
MLIISNTDQCIRTMGAYYSANDLFKASGGENKNRITFFLQNDSTKALIKVYESESYDVGNPTAKKKALKVVKGKGKNQGTYLCRELVYAYAMWISPEFTLMVIRAFDSIAIHHQQLSLQLNQLCQDFTLISDRASNAGRYLSILGKQVKPELKRQIDDTLKQMQPSLNFDGTDNALIDDLGGDTDE